jgi:nucleotide-binding universal stress UspA family protein
MTVLKPRSVLIAVDPAEIPDQALALASELLVPAEATHLVAVMPASESTTPQFNWGTIDGESREAYARRNLTERLKDTRYAAANLHIAFGDAAEQIARLAASLDIDLLVVPARNQRSRLARMVKTSVAEQLLRISPCPVLMLPMDPESRRAAVKPEEPPPPPPSEHAGHRGTW